MTDMSQSHHYDIISYHSLLIITTSYSIPINDVISHYTYHTIYFQSTAILHHSVHILSHYCTIPIMGSFLGLFHPLLIISSTHTNNTLNVYTLGPYDLKYILSSKLLQLSDSSSIYLQEDQAPSKCSSSLVHPFTAVSASGWK